MAVALILVGLVLWALATVGATMIVTQSWLFRGLRAALSGAVVDTEPRPEGYKDPSALGYWWPTKARALGVLVHCPMCLGFWWGAAFGAPLVAGAGLALGVAVSVLALGAPLLVFAFGCAGSWLSWLGYLHHCSLGGKELI